MTAVCTWMTALALLAAGPTPVEPAPEPAAPTEAPVADAPSTTPDAEPTAPDGGPTTPQPDLTPTDEPVPDVAPPDGTEPSDERATPDPFAEPPPSDPSTAATPEPEPEPTTVAPAVTEDELVEEDFDEDFADEPFDTDYDPLRDSPEAIAATRRVRTGIALLSVGGALLVGATVFGTVDACRRWAGNSCQEAASKRAALTMALPGIAFVAGGAVSLGLGLHRRQRIRATLTAGRDGGGIVVVGRF